jgi:uncharacterized cupredoxin-like copper-binding protein
MKTAPQHTLPLVLLLTGLWLGSTTAYAHGPSGHHSKPVSPAEQKDWGIAGDQKKVDRTVEVVMTDNMQFTPNKLQVRLGETIRLMLANQGKVMHEMVIGTQKELAAHAEMMKKFPNMEHDEPYMAHVSPGKREDLVWTFNRAGRFEFACLVAGHFEAGMRGTIEVADAASGGTWATGLIRRLDPANNRLTIQHGEIKSLDMPPMTMVFTVKAPNLLDGLGVGEQIEFQATAEGNRYVVSAIRKAGR